MAERDKQVSVSGSQGEGGGQGLARGQGAGGLQAARRGAPLGRYGGGIGSPFGMLRRMMEDMDRMLEDIAFGGFDRSRIVEDLEGAARGMFSPALEVVQRGNDLLVRADLPGLKKDEVRVQLLPDALLIEGERKSESETTEANVYQSERSYGAFQRRIPLPRGIDLGAVDATFDNGVLEVKIGLPKETKRAIEVKVGGGGAKPGGQAKEQAKDQGKDQPQAQPPAAPR